VQNRSDLLLSLLGRTGVSVSQHRLTAEPVLTRILMYRDCAIERGRIASLLSC